MTRSARKGPFVEEKLRKRIAALNSSGQKMVLKTWCRSCVILPEMIGHTIAIHDGRRHVPLLITEDMVGHRLGEFAPTRVFRGHTGKVVTAPGKFAPTRVFRGHTGKVVTAPGKG